jgi:hypothetical protein
VKNNYIKDFLKIIYNKIKHKMYFQGEYKNICSGIKYFRNESVMKEIIKNRVNMKNKHIKEFLDIAVNNLNEEILIFLECNNYFDTGIELKNCSIRKNNIEYYDKMDMIKKILIKRKNNI